MIIEHMGYLEQISVLAGVLSTGYGYGFLTRVTYVGLHRATEG